MCVFHGSGVGLMGWRLGCDWNIVQGQRGGDGRWLQFDRDSYTRGAGWITWIGRKIDTYL